ncbi:MAG: hypothetical protein WBS24_02135 [Terriglobales bacterium]
MTKYEEIKEVALAAQRNFSERQQRSWQYGAKLVQGFASYCEIPKENIRVMRWNGDEAHPPYEEAEPGHNFVAPSAMKFDEESETWRFGLRIILTPSQWVFFGLHVADSDGRASIRIGTGEVRKIDPDDQNQWNELYNSIVGLIKGCHQGGIAKRSGIGFSIGT